MAYDSDTHRAQILALLSTRGLTRPRIPQDEPDDCEIIVTVASATSILDIAAAERELHDLVGIDVDIVPERSERGIEAEASAVAL